MSAWPILFAAPHRGLFATGMMQGLVAMSLWAMDLGARYGGLGSPVDWSLPSIWLHGMLMGFSVFGPFIFGFILTAGPRWQQLPEIDARLFRPVVVLTVAGWLLADAGLMFASSLVPGLVLALVGWGLATGSVWELFRRSQGDRLHIGLMAAALTAGGAGLAAFAWLAGGGPAWLGPLAIAVMLWSYLLPVFAVVLHRMLPFFSQSVIPGFPTARPRWPLLVIVAGSLAHGILHGLELSGLAWLADLPVTVAALRLILLWRLPESFRARILAVLHVGFAWLGLAFGLFSADSLLRLAGAGGLGLAPLHALTLGFFSSIMVGMASRVTLGHSGRAIVGDRVMWACFWAMQLTALMRIAAEFLWPWLNPAAALLWLLAFAVWVVRYAPAYWRAREDGQPG